jgi:hypothetical protein
VYNVSTSSWRYLTGSTVIDMPDNEKLGGRANMAYWKDAGNHFYVFSGSGVAGARACIFFLMHNNSTFSYSINIPSQKILDQSVWKFDYSETNPTWIYVAGSNSTNAAGVVSNQPTPRVACTCADAGDGGAYCFGGVTYLNCKL